MKVCLLNYEYPPIGAGAATATEAMAQALVRLGHEAIVVTSAFGGLSGMKDESGVQVLRLPTGRKRADACSIREMAVFAARASLQLPSIIKTRKCDGIIAFFSIPCGPAAWWAAARCGVPYVISLRGGDVPGTEPSLNGMHRFLALFRRMILRRARTVIANSEGLRQLSLAADPVPVEVIPNGVDTVRFSPSKAPRGDDAFRVLAVGRLQDQKNHTFALRILAKAKAGLAGKLEYHIVGDGPLRVFLEKQADELGLASNIVWHGWTTRDQMPDLYRSCDCLLHPTLYEGMPNVVLEAMSCGLPVVVSDVAGNRETVKDGVTGFVRQLGEEAPFVEVLTDLSANVELRTRLGHAARECVRSEYDWERVACRYVEVLGA